MRRKLLTIPVLFMMILTALLSGCSKYGIKTFYCDSNNHIGLEAIFASFGGRITIFLDEDYAVEGKYPYGQFKTLFEEEEYPEDKTITVIAKNGTKAEIDADDITIDGDEYTISFTVEGIDPKDIKIIRLYSTIAQYSEINLDNVSIKTETGGGEATTYVVQTYDVKDDFWNDLETNIQTYSYFEISDEEPEVLATREYFETLDKDNTGLDQIVEDIGGYGIEGSGILYYVWNLKDGSKAKVVFDSNGKIVRIYIEEGYESELIYKREY